MARTSEMAARWLRARCERWSRARSAAAPVNDEDVTLGIFSAANPVRRFAQRLVAALWFEHAILMLVIINVATLAMETSNQPGYSTSHQAAVLRIVDIIIVAVFTVRTGRVA
jgi:hypothetical protein